MERRRIKRTAVQQNNAYHTSVAHYAVRTEGKGGSTQAHREKRKQERGNHYLGEEVSSQGKGRRRSWPILNGTAQFGLSDKLKRRCLPTLAGKFPCSKQEGQIGHEQKDQATRPAPLSSSLVRARWRVAAAMVSKACAARERLHLTSVKCVAQHLLPGPLPSQRRCPKKNFQSDPAGASQDPAARRQVRGRVRLSNQSRRFEILLLESSLASRHSVHHNP